MEINTPVRNRRTHTESFKQSVIDACQVPGTSVAGVALTHGVNANQVRRWLRERKRPAAPHFQRQPNLIST